MLLAALLQALAAGTLLALAFPAPGLWPLVLLGLVPLVRAAEGAPRGRRAFLAGWVAGSAWFGVAFHWIYVTLTQMSHLPAAAAALGTLLYGMYHGTWVGGFAWVVQRTREWPARRRYAARALAWSLPEVLFPWIFPLPVADALYRAPWLMQAADLVGVHGLGVLVVLVNLLVADLWRELRVRSGAWRRPALLAGAVLAAWGAYGVVRPLLLPAQAARTIRVAWIQPNITPREKEISDPDVRLSILAREWPRIQQGMAAHPSLVVLPEGAFSFYLQEPNSDKLPGRPEIDDWSRRYLTLPTETGTPLVFGTLRRTGGISRNTAVTALPDGRYLMYDKRFLVPFGEHIPFADWIPALRNRVAGMSHLEAGDASPLVAAAGLTAHLSICYEAIFPQAVARDARGADLLLNLTNDEWFGPVGAPEMHLMAQTFRAVENRRPLVRVTNTGISAWVDLRGRVQHRSPLNTETQGLWEVPLAAAWSLFAWAPWGVTGAMWLAGLLLALPWSRRGRVQRRDSVPP